MCGGGGGGGGQNIMHCWYNDHQRRLVAALSAKSTSPLQTPATDSPSLLTKLAPLALIHHHVLGCTQAASSRMETCRITLVNNINKNVVLHASCEKKKKIIGSSTMHYV